MQHTDRRLQGWFECRGHRKTPVCLKQHSLNLRRPARGPHKLHTTPTDADAHKAARHLKQRLKPDWPALCIIHKEEDVLVYISPDGHFWGRTRHWASSSDLWCLNLTETHGVENKLFTIFCGHYWILQHLKHRECSKHNTILQRNTGAVCVCLFVCFAQLT